MYRIKDEKINENLLWCRESEFDKIDSQYNSRKINFKWSYIIWKILTDSKFRFRLKYTILYAFRWENFIRGSDSSDIFLFKGDHARRFFIIKDEL